MFRPVEVFIRPALEHFNTTRNITHDAHTARRILSSVHSHSTTCCHSTQL